MVKCIGQKLLKFDVLDSTQNYAKEICSESPSGTVVIADSQTEGRGRLNRSWNSKQGLGIWMSIILKPNLQLADFPKITLVVAVALQESLASFGLNPKIKWPNDILVDGKKLSGILTEIVGGNTVIVGCGINVKHSLEDLPVELREKATSMELCLNRKLDREDIYSKFFAKFDEYLEIFELEGFEFIRSKWLENTDSIGRDVVVEMATSKLRGKIFGIDHDGVLLVEDRNLVLHRVISGDVVYL